jgi:hypothetical protein
MGNDAIQGMRIDVLWIMVFLLSQLTVWHSAIIEF